MSTVDAGPTGGGAAGHVSNPRRDGGADSAVGGSAGSGAQNPVVDAGTNPVVDAGTKPVVDAGTKPAVDAGTKPFVDAGTDAGTTPVVDAGTTPVVDAGTTPVVDAGTDSGVPDAGRPPPQCGDGVLDVGELCDDGNQANDDFCNATCTGLDFLCATDHADARQSYGSVQVPDSRDFVALCGGHIIATSADQLGLAVYDVRHHQVVWTHALGAAPAALALDRDHGYLYASLQTMQTVVRIDLLHQTELQIPVVLPYGPSSARVTALVLGNNGLVFGSYSSGSSGVVIDGPAGVVLLGDIAGVAASLAYDRKHDQLFAATVGTGTMHASRWAYTASPPSLTLVEALDVGTDGYSARVSPDGSSVAFVAGQGNDRTRWGSSLFDWPTSSFDHVRGDWTRRAWVPVDAAFSPDSQYLVISDFGSPEVFDVNPDFDSTCVGSGLKCLNLFGSGFVGAKM